MRRKRSDINVFSMSALDLFACALGAFVLLAVVFLPFFPNTGDHPGVAEAVMERLARAEANVADLQAASAEKDATIAEIGRQVAGLQSQNSSLQSELEDALSSVQFPAVDIVIALDSTGSMSGQINGLRSEIGQFATLMRSLSPSVGMGIVEFKDRCDTPVLRTFNLVEINQASLARLQTFANQISARSGACNTEHPEAVLDALRAATEMPWRPASRVRMVLIITDNPAYPEEVEASFALAAAFRSRAPGNAVSTALVVTPGADPQARPFLSQLAREGGGQAVDAGGSFTAMVLLALAET